MEIAVILLGIISGALATSFTIGVISAGSKDKVVPVIANQFIFLGGILGAILGVLAAVQPLAILRWLIIPLSALGTILIFALALAFVLVMQFICKRILGRVQSLGERLGNRIGKK